MQRITLKLEHRTRHQSMRDVRVARCRSTNAATCTDDAGARTSDASDNPGALGQIFSLSWRDVRRLPRASIRDPAQRVRRRRSSGRRSLRHRPLRNSPEFRPPAAARCPCHQPASTARPFSQRMPPVQKLTTVASASAARCDSSAPGNSVNVSMGSVNAPWNVPYTTSCALRVSNSTNGRPRSSLTVTQPLTQHGRRHRRRATLQRRSIIAPEADDFRFDLDLEPRERLIRALAVLDTHPRKTRIGLQPGVERANLLGIAGQEQVDTFLGNQHRPFQRLLFGLREHACRKCLRMLDGDELVGGGIGNHADIFKCAGSR